MTQPSHDGEKAQFTGEGMLQVRQAVRLGLIALLCYWALVIIFPLLGLILWAVILAVAAYPIFEWLKHLMGGRAGLAAMSMCFLGLALVIGPVVFLTDSLIETVRLLAAGVKSGTLTLPRPPEAVAHWPIVGADLYRGWVAAATNIQQVVAEYSAYVLKVGRYAIIVVAHSGFELIVFLLSILLAGYLFVAGPRIISGVIRFLEQAAPGHGLGYIETIGRTIRGVAQGVIGVALVQSLLAGLVLLLFHVPGAGLITFIALLLGITQIGPGIILVPVAVWALFTGEPQWSVPLAIILAAITFLDNVLKPIVLAKGLNTPMLVIFFGVVGGLLHHGLIGIFIGPVVLAIVWELLLIWIGQSDERR